MPIAPLWGVPRRPPQTAVGYGFHEDREWAASQGWSWLF